MSLYERVVRPALFLLPAETAHNLGKRALSVEFPWRVQAKRFQVPDPRLETEVAGIRQVSPIGLTAGFDKDALALPGLSHLGFGSLTVGAIMPEPRAGNPKPRLMRRPVERALVNCMGLPSKGLAYAVRKLRRYREAHPSGDPPIIANVGGFTVEEILSCFRAVEPLVDAVELDLTCPNVKVEGELAEMEGIVRAMKGVLAERKKPVLTKLPLRSSDEDWRRALDMSVAAAEVGLDGITAGGSLRVEESRVSMGKGSLTGPPVLENTLRIVRDLRSAVGDRLTIRISGGAADGDGAFRLLEAGADAVNVLTAFVYQGPAVAARMNRGLLRKMDEAGVRSVRELKSRPSVSTAAAR
ncbi:MAG: dihydroorotate dehydrogenase 2 [bacterium]